MSKLSEEKILDDINFCLEGEYITPEHYEAIQGLLNLYNKEKEKNKELEEYKKISELTKISCCTAQNCEALNNAIREGLENQKLREQLEQEKKANDIDLTIVYMNGFYDGEDKWKKKIKEKIDFYKRYGKIKNSNEYVMSVEIELLEELLDEERKNM